MDLYEMLGIDKDASQDEIRKAYRKAANRDHPDKKGGDKERFQAIKHAYEILGDETSRAIYDETGSTDGEDPAINILSSLFMSEMQKFNFKDIDYVSSVLETLQSKVRGAEGNIKKSKMMARRIKVILKNLTLPKPIRTIIENELLGLESSIKEGENVVATYHRSIDLLEKCEYTGEVKEQASSGQPNWYFQDPHIS